MKGIMVFSHRLIILYALKHFWKHSPYGIFKETVSVTHDDGLDKQYWISQSGESHDSVTHFVNKYVTCTHSAQIRQVSIWYNASGRWQCPDHCFQLSVTFLFFIRFWSGLQQILWFYELAFQIYLLSMLASPLIKYFVINRYIPWLQWRHRWDASLIGRPRWSGSTLIFRTKGDIEG